MSIDNVMAIRNAILARNAAIQNVASSPPSAVIGPVGGAPTFEAAMNAVLQKTDGAGTVGDINTIGGFPPTGPAQQGGFTEAIKAQVRYVNEIGAQAGALTNAYERGDETDIAQVMLARQRSSIGFEATLQVRNKLLSAYKDIMGMAV